MKKLLYEARKRTAMRLFDLAMWIHPELENGWMTITGASGGQHWQVPVPAVKVNITEPVGPTLRR